MILNVPADDAADEIVARMLTIILQKRGVAAATLRAGMPAGGQVEESDIARVRVVCISALPPLAPIRARHRVARARVRAPEAQVVLGLWRLQTAGTELRQRLGPARDVPIATTLVDAAALTAKLLENGAAIKDSQRTTR
jgi:hypothetical protein